MIKLLFALGSILTSCSAIYGSFEINKDSLYKVIDETTNDTVILASYFELGSLYLKKHPDSSILMFEKSIDLISTKLKSDKLQKEEEAYFNRALPLANNRIGFIQYRRGKMEEALKVFALALNQYENLQDSSKCAVVLLNIANIYNNQNEYESAFEYSLRASEIFESQGPKQNLGPTYSLMGGILERLKKRKMAREYFLKSLLINQETGNEKGISSNYNNLGMSYLKSMDTSKAIEYLKLAAESNFKFQNDHKLSLNYYNLGSIYYKQGDFKKATEYSKKSMESAKVNSYPIQLSKAAKLLSLTSAHNSDWRTAYESYKTYVKMRDSLQNEKNKEAAIKDKLQYEYEKKTEIDSIKTAERDKLNESKLANAALREQKQKQQNYFLYGALALSLIFGVFVYNRFKITKKQRDIIDVQKQRVELQKKDIQKQKLLVDQAYDQLEEKNSEILNSINYAKRIQSAILPPDNLVKNHIPKSFILYQPKDIVAGDFYWLETTDEATYIAAADCTGHGVPGALVSIVCNNALNRSVREYGLTEPKEILNKTREIVIEEFDKSEEEVKDGMDIALCAITKNTVNFAGANNPLWIVRKTEYLTKKQHSERSTILGSQYSLIEYRASKQPIGLYAGMKEFDQYEIQKCEGDIYYLFSDGFADQFGGPKGKKYKYKPFKEFLIKIQDLEMNEKKTAIQNEFNQWKSDFEQVDDLCVIGFRF